jgi:mannosylglycoprotein endo-beta-mannosidase
LDELGISEHNLSDLDLPSLKKRCGAQLSRWHLTRLLVQMATHAVCCPIIKDDVMAAISAVWSRKTVNLGVLNSSYITLLPKKEDADQLKDFRPISLVHSFAKLVTKLLANHFAPKLQEMVSPVQSAFTKGHFIQDNFMLVQQTARYLHEQKEPHILLKLDISKAFDLVSWPFLLEILQQLGFGQIW